MDSFSDAFKTAKAALANGELDGDFKKLHKGLKSLLGDVGPNLADKGQLVELRDKVASGAKKLAAKGTTGAAASAMDFSLERAGNADRCHAPAP